MIAVAEAAKPFNRKRHIWYPTDDFELSDVPALANVTEAVKARVLPLMRHAISMSAAFIYGATQ